MPDSRIARVLVKPQPAATTAASLAWLAPGLVYALYCSLMWTARAFRHPYLIQSDARQVVTWLLRFSDPELFRNDMIADYYISANTDGFNLIYRAAAAAGLDPIWFAKIRTL